MLGRLWSDTVSRVRVTAAEVQHQVTQRAAKAREAFGLTRSFNTGILEHYLISQAISISSLSSLEDLCHRWLKELKATSQGTLHRYVEESPVDIRRGASAEVAALPKSSGNGSSHGQRGTPSLPESSPPPPLSPGKNSSKREDGFTEGNTRNPGKAVSSASTPPKSSTISAKAALSPPSVSSHPPGHAPSSQYEGGSLAHVHDETLAPTVENRFPSKKQRGDASEKNLEGIMSLESIGLTFKQVLLRSKALERLILTVFRNPELVEQLMGPLEAVNEGFSAREGLLRLFNECLGGNERLHREILSLLMTMDPSWKGHVEWVTLLISTIKLDWLDDRYLDLRRIMAGEITDLKRNLSHYVVPHPTEVLTGEQESLIKNGLVQHNIRVLASRKLIQLYQLMEKNMMSSATRRRVILKSVTADLKSLSDRMTAKEDRYEKKASAAAVAQEQLKVESEKVLVALSGDINQHNLEFHSYDERLESLESQRSKLLEKLEEVSLQIEEVQNVRRLHSKDMERQQMEWSSKQTDFQNKIAAETRHQISNQQQKVDARNIQSIAHQSRDFAFKTLPLHAKCIDDAAGRLKGPLVTYLQHHLSYEKDRILHQGECIGYFSNMLSKLAEVDTSTIDPELVAEQEIQQMECQSALMLALNQLDSMWSEFRSFALSCEKILTLSITDLPVESSITFMLDELSASSDSMGESKGNDDTSYSLSAKEGSGTKTSLDTPATPVEMQKVDFKKCLDELETLYVHIRGNVAPWIQLMAEGGSKADDDIRPHDEAEDVQFSLDSHMPSGHFHSMDLMDEIDHENLEDSMNFFSEQLDAETVEAIQLIEKDAALE
ncbi:hypothetical protein IE077_000447 [Cardiosporidium cionae]|uniref:Uncharacterized protein n=1 Tax=Cardiosporidium cionae TaxID=476202 RepID=A0ABQ7J9G7_9APIC|nr:hypothetical protein IE077_000447 [Cardiosporidium cionae]|eukprot:KAF8820594.1 hypothetical protein IE077_000447 [Cardiosporidium cionae]